ncbi:hypothetical protein PQX77_001524 [Marasmius sp. AFHP31]|nr:hypothetical protein PQX77_001524 [Marasmius sp. AFHP31]
MEEMGLAAIVMYEIPRSEPLDSKETQGTRWTVESVFGCRDDPSKGGMTEEQLLDEIQVRVVYTPSYACTSFVTGQVMQSFLRECAGNAKGTQPVPAPSSLGIGIQARSFNFFDNDLSSSFSSTLLDVRKLLRPVPPTDCAPRYSRDNAVWPQPTTCDPDALEMEWVELHLLNPRPDDRLSSHGSFVEFDDTSSHLEVTYALNAFNFTPSESTDLSSSSLSASNSVDIAASFSSHTSTSDCSLLAVGLLEPSGSFEVDIGDVSICTLVSDIGSSSSQSSLYFGPLTPAKPSRHRPDPSGVPPTLIRFDKIMPTPDCFPIYMDASHVDCEDLFVGRGLSDSSKKNCVVGVNADAVSSKFEQVEGKAHVMGRGKENIPPPPARV